MPKRWTVIIRTQGVDNELELKDAINSIIAQDYENISVIITIHSDNEKKIKNTLSFLKPFRKILDIETIVLREKQNIRSYPLNEALKKLDADYVSFLDHDDIYYPQMGSILINLLEKKKKTFAYGTSIKVLQKKVTDKWGVKYLYTINKSKFKTKDFNRISFLLDNYIPFNTFIVKSSLINGQKFDERLYYLEDWDFLRRLSLKKDFSLAQTKIPVSEYRVREDDTDSFNKKNYSKWVKSRKITDNNIQKEEILLDLKTINQFNKEVCQENFFLQEEINKIKNNPAYKLWVYIRDLRLINRTIVRLIRYLRGKFAQK